LEVTGFRREEKIEALKAEIDFYKDMTAKVFTVDFATIVATVANFKSEGFTFWSAIGFLVSYGLALVMAMLIVAYKDRVNRLKNL